MVSSRTVAVLALHAGKLRRRRLADEPGRQAIPQRMAGKTTGVPVLVRGLKHLKRLGVGGVLEIGVDWPVALDAHLRARVLRRRT